MIDKLNNLQTKYPKIDYREWFDEVDIPEEDKEKRIELAEKIDPVFEWLFMMVAVAAATQTPIDTEYLVTSVQYRLFDLVDLNIRYVEEHIEKVAGEVVDTTIKYQDEEFYLSPERSSELSANEAHAYYNYEELQDAWENGKTKKTWISEKTRTTRKDHWEMHGTTIPIEDMFVFPDCEMIVPHDNLNGTARQVANCKCSVRFS